MSRCRDISSLLEPYSDGELSPDKNVEVEQHIEDCQQCSARTAFDRSLKKSMRKVTYEAAPVNPAFLTRLGVALEAEREREVELLEEKATSNPRVLSWRAIAPLAAAAALALFWGAGKRDSASRPPGELPSLASAALGDVNVDQFIEDLVDYHLSPEEPVVTDSAQLEQFDPQVGVPVRLPRLSDYGVRWEGGQVVPIRNRRAALLRYHSADGHKMTLYVYNAERVPIERRLKARTVRNESVYVGYKRGFSIAATERRGVGYALATDLDDNESAEIVASLHTP